MMHVTFSADGQRFMLLVDLPDGTRANLCARVDLEAYGGAVQTWRNGHCVARYEAAEGTALIARALRPAPH